MSVFWAKKSAQSAELSILLNNMSIAQCIAYGADGEGFALQQFGDCPYQWSSFVLRTERTGAFMQIKPCM